MKNIQIKKMVGALLVLILSTFAQEATVVISEGVMPLEGTQQSSTTVDNGSKLSAVDSKEDPSAQLDTVENAVQSLMARAGIAFTGEFKSRGLSSKLDGHAVDSFPADKATENVLYTSVDLNITARPLEAIGGTLIFRLHEDWQNMFASFHAPLTTRWVSIDGNAKNIFRYNVGDFKAKFSPLTLWSPENDLLYEAYVFDRQKQEVMGEEFLGDNNRVLQGVNLQWGAQIGDKINELSFHAYGARLRTAGKYTDTTKTPESILANASTDRYSSGITAYIEPTFGLGIGGTFIYTGDAFSTYQSNPQDTLQSKNMVFGGNLSYSTKSISAIDTAKFTADIYAEFSYSNYDSYGLDYTAVDKFIKRQSVSGMAIDVNLDLGFGLGEAGHLQLLTGFNRTDADYLNEMAQSPSFFRKNILNTANGVASPGANTYNVFDAMYKHVFKYIPAEGESGIRAPVRKIAYTSGVLTQEEMQASYKAGLIETELNPVLPFGEATGNRVGGHATIKADFLDRMLLVEVRGSKFSEISLDKYLYGTPYVQPQVKTDWLSFGGGVSADIAKIGNWWAYPFIISGSFMRTNVSNALGQVTSVGSFTLGGDQGINLINAGLYFKFLKNLALIGGYQQLSNDNITSYGPLTDNSTLQQGYKRTQSNWAGGLEYRVAEGAVLTGTVGQTIVDYNFINQYDYDALQLDLFLTVQF